MATVAETPFPLSVMETSEAAKANHHLRVHKKLTSSLSYPYFYHLPPFLPFLP